MLFLCNILPSDLESPEIRARIKEYERQFGEAPVYSSYTNYRLQGRAKMEQVYLAALEAALESGKPFAPPDQLADEAFQYDE